MGITSLIMEGRTSTIVGLLAALMFLAVKCEDTKGHDPLGSHNNPAQTCKGLKRHNPAIKNGLYYIIDKEGNVYQTYCDMEVGGGGWSLVASIHENNMNGRCTTGDRWSSEQGVSALHPHGDGFWENRATHGIPASATSDDYKNPGYFSMHADDIMIWHVPNDTPLPDIKYRALFKYYTNTGFLPTFGGNLGHLYSHHFKIRDGIYKVNVDNGPAIPVVWAKGTKQSYLDALGSHTRNEVDSGYVQFRAINHEGNAFALCPGVKIKTGKGNVEHMCIGSTSSNTGYIGYFGDFSGLDWPGWTASTKILQSSVLIFYR